MILNCSGRETYIFEYMDLVAREEFLSPVSVLFYLLEIILIFFTFLLVFLVAYLNFYDPIWHRNLQFLMGYYVVGCVPSHLARLLYIWYEAVEHIETDLCQVTLIMATIIRLQYGFALMHAAVALILERAAAFYFLKDYERKSRCYIAFTILLFQIGLSGAMAVFNIFDSVSFRALFIYMSLLASGSIVSFCILWQLNLYKYRRISTSASETKYSLSKRFQLTENLRAFQSIRNMEICCVLLLFIVGAVGYFMVNGWNTVLGVHSFEILVSCSPLGVCCSLLLSSEKWRTFVRRKGKTAETAVRRIEPDEGQVYFDELNKAWNRRPNTAG